MLSTQAVQTSASCSTRSRRDQVRRLRDEITRLNPEQVCRVSNVISGMVCSVKGRALSADTPSSIAASPLWAATQGGCAATCAEPSGTPPGPASPSSLSGRRCLQASNQRLGRVNMLSLLSACTAVTHNRTASGNHWVKQSMHTCFLRRATSCASSIEMTAAAVATYPEGQAFKAPVKSCQPQLTSKDVFTHPGTRSSQRSAAQLGT